jgi:protein involved in polysaccharide export with SLBB domain
LNISVVEQPDLSRVYAVAGDGSIDFAFAGRVVIAEMTEDEAEQKLEAVLEKDYFREAHVSISIANFVEGDILVHGEVANPGVLSFRGDSILTLMEAVLRSGGLTDRAAADRVQIIRWLPGGRMERDVVVVDLQEILDGAFEKDQYLRPRDTVMVPRRGEGDVENPEFLALGEVVKPGFYPYRPDLDVIKAVTRVGGLGEFADWSAARILRKRAGGSDYTVIPLDLGRLFSAADMKLNLKLQKGDIFFVPSTRNQVRQQVYLLGEVPHPGAVAITPGPDATVARMILAQGGATQYAYPKSVKVYRYAPDGSRKMLEVNVEKILDRGTFEDDVPMQDGDVVIVPEKTLWNSILGF